MSNTLQQIKQLSELCTLLENNSLLVQVIDKISDNIIKAYKNGNKTIFCGNGGSSAEAQHLAAELSGRFKLERPAIPAEACHVNSSFVTAVSNDYDFTKVYSRYIEAFGQQGDVLIGLSTSGTSENIVNAFHAAREKGLTTVAFTGESGGDLNDLSDLILKVPSENVPRIQEIHLLVGHIICEKVELTLFGNDK
ncbi:SIS domain-containing protein [Draconibacterium sp. IB214405]|uniref:D-sedoheptulose-7-phosphate isomerase n=1 Tax=Draconibacterium sp. IB214405 TaxID=3097352 RepID=UPI002A0B9460|nr:SIS domain-containing protein [Draconibacterium sp. IB214405]MDX8340928.1 SIS domain-containing protein [Draconibacterium sp. IB214405]